MHHSRSDRRAMCQPWCYYSRYIDWFYPTFLSFLTVLETMRKTNRHKWLVCRFLICNQVDHIVWWFGHDILSITHTKIDSLSLTTVDKPSPERPSACPAFWKHRSREPEVMIPQKPDVNIHSPASTYDTPSVVSTASWFINSSWMTDWLTAEKQRAGVCDSIDFVDKTVRSRCDQIVLWNSTASFIK